MKTLFEQNGEFPIRLEQRTSGTFRVTYGMHIRDNIKYEEAAHELGEFIMHDIACSGRMIAYGGSTK